MIEKFWQIRAMYKVSNDKMAGLIGKLIDPNKVPTEEIRIYTVAGIKEIANFMSQFESKLREESKAEKTKRFAKFRYKIGYAVGKFLRQFLPKTKKL